MHSILFFKKQLDKKFLQENLTLQSSSERKYLNGITYNLDIQSNNCM
jgi:hypothetical protein